MLTPYASAGQPTANSFQDSGAAYLYYPDDTVKTLTDARGVVTRFTYDERHMTTGVVYDRGGITSVATDKGGSTPVAHTPSVTYEYDAAGNRKRMTTQDADNDGAADAGEVEYAYDDFSRLSSETRRFPGLTAAYTLSYQYALSGALKKVTDANSGAGFAQSFDRAGQLEAVSGVGFEGANTQFISNVSSRAWGAPQALSYGNGVSLSFGYDASGQVAASALHVKMPGAIDPPNQTRTYKSEYSFYSDGGVKYVKEQLAENGGAFGGDGVRDRAYQYDFADRLTDAYTGGEARDFVNHTTGSPAKGPYRQSYTYDVWGHTKSVTGSYWGRADETPIDYDASGRNPAWEYDPQGRLVSRNEEAYDGTVVSYQPLRNAFDAAGREVAASQAMTITDGNQLHPHVISNSMVYDGDGLLARVVLGHTVDGQPGPDHKTTYQLRSSALGGRVISEYDAQGVWRETYVYAGGERVGAQGKRLPFGAQQWQAYNTWRHADPVTGDEAATGANGGLLGRTTFDPQGVDVGESDPFPADGAGDEDGLVNHYNNSPSGQFVIELVPSLNSGRQCVQDGLRTSCAFISESAVKLCPDNDCQSARRVTVTSVAGGRVVGRSSTIVQPGEPGWDGSLDGQYGVQPKFKGVNWFDAADFIQFLTNGPEQWGSSYSELVWRKSGSNTGAPQPRPRNPMIPLTDLGKNITVLLNDSDCGKFVTSLIKTVAAATKNPAHSADGLELYEKINEGRGGYVIEARYTSTGRPMGGTVGGSIGMGDAKVYIAPQYLISSSLTPGLVDKVNLNVYAISALHETIHHAGTNGYYGDTELAAAAYALMSSERQAASPLPKRSDFASTEDYVFAVSGYWDAELSSNCKPKRR